RQSCNKSSSACDYVCDERTLPNYQQCSSRTYCKTGYWGSWCENKCLEESCEKCDASSAFGLCSKCKTGFWGHNCSSRCPIDKCIECHIDDGHCTLCKNGFWGRNCDLQCPDQCRCCDAVSGICMQDKCLNIINQQNVSDNDTLTIVDIVLIVCSIIVAGVSVITFIFCFYIQRRRIKQKSKQQKKKNNNNAKGSKGEVDGMTDTKF
ncbi:cell death abnormality protein 1-like, partial [Ruditapes philippinarum]|uniref:cell death abnormality protein 1-like n=1 Tax=Ruditapes philippinarum TaxID=129788 RepID=UPI00295B0212